MTPKIKLYGTERCHKTKYYQAFLENIKVEYVFLDVEKKMKTLLKSYVVFMKIEN